MAPDPVHEGSASRAETAALELLYALPSDATYEERLVGWIVADWMARLGMPLPWDHQHNPASADERRS